MNYSNELRKWQKRWIQFLTNFRATYEFVVCFSSVVYMHISKYWLLMFHVIQIENAINFNAILSLSNQAIRSIFVCNGTVFLRSVFGSFVPLNTLWSLNNIQNILQHQNQAEGVLSSTAQAHCYHIFTHHTENRNKMLNTQQWGYGSSSREKSTHTHTHLQNIISEFTTKLKYCGKLIIKVFSCEKFLMWFRHAIYTLYIYIYLLCHRLRNRHQNVRTLLLFYAHITNP